MVWRNLILCIFSRPVFSFYAAILRSVLRRGQFLRSPISKMANRPQHKHLINISRFRTALFDLHQTRLAKRRRISSSEIDQISLFLKVYALNPKIDMGDLKN